MRQGEAESDFTPKRLARLLNFTAICRSSANAALSHHPKLQSPPRRQSPEVLQCRVLRQPRRIPHPVQRLPLLIAQLAKQESPGSQARNIVEVKDGTPKKGKQCNCKNSRCLKLYCECFAAGIYCNGCKCLNCFNNVENEAARQEAVGLTLDRNPNAFRPKIATSPQGCLEAREHVREAQIIGKHSKGCHCKRSGCLKKYCECFQANILCSENCKCMDCKNFEGSEERRSLSPGNHNSVAYMQQAANAAINQAISSSGYRTSLATRKRKSEEHPYRVTRGQVAHSTGKLKQENHQNNAAASLTLSAGQIPEATNATVLGSPKLNYKYPLAGGILTSQAVNDICSLFVLRSHEVIKELSGKVDIQGEKRYYHTSNTTALHIQEGGHDIKGHEAHKISTDDYSNGNKTTLGTNGSNLEDERPALLETDLMCHEKEMEFTELIEYCKNKSKMTCSEHESSHLYTEQEKLILTMFRDFLNRLVTSGDTEENQQDRQIVEKGEINQRRRTELLVEGSSVDKYRPQSKSLLQNLTW